MSGILQRDDIPVEVYIESLKDVVMNSVKQVESQLTKLYKVTSTDKLFTERHSFAGLRPFSPWTGTNGDVIRRQKISKRYKIRIDQYFFASAVEYDWPTKKFVIQHGKYDALKEPAQQLIVQSVNTRELVATAPWNTAFTVNAYDGVPLFSASHPLANGAVESNLVNGPISHTSVRNAIKRLRAIRDDQGLPMRLRPTAFWVPQAEEDIAWEILKSAGRSDTANRSDNWLAQNWKSISIETSDYLTSTTAFMLQSNFEQIMGKPAAVLEVSEELEQDQWEDKDTKSTVHSALIGFGQGFLDFRWGVGSLGV